MKINRVILDFEKWFSAALLTFMCTLYFVQVIARYFFDTGWAWVHEMVILACITLTYVGASTGVKSGVHIGVDVIIKLLPIRFHRYSKIFADISGLVLYVFMACISLQFVLHYKEMGTHSIITGFPMWIMVCYMPIGFMLMAFHYAESLWEHHKNRKQAEMKSNTESP